MSSAFVELGTYRGYRPAHAFGYRRPPLLLFDHTRPPGRARDHHGTVVDMGNRSERTPGRPRLYAALAGAVRHRCRAGLCLYASDTRSGGVARRRADGDGARLRRGAAAGRFLHRPHAARPLARTCRKSARDAERDLARAVAGGSCRHRRAQSARRLGALRAHALRQWATVLARPAHRIAARSQFHAGRMVRRAFLPAIATALRDAVSQRAGAGRPAIVADLFRRHRRRGAEAALPGRACRTARLAPRLRAGLLAAGSDTAWPKGGRYGAPNEADDAFVIGVKPCAGWQSSLYLRAGFGVRHRRR